MLHLFSGSSPWFAPKSHGYGAGLPTAWQGWVLMLSYMAAVIGLGVLAGSAGGYAMLGIIALIIALTVVFVLIVKARTAGEWRWRWGEED